MPRTPTRVALLATCATLVVLLPSAAFAEKTVVTEHGKDVWSVTTDQQTGDHDYTRLKRTRANVDLDRVVLRHTRRAVVLTASYTDLDKKAGYLLLTASLRTDDGDRFVATVDTSVGWDGDNTLKDSRGNIVDCDLGVRIRFRDDHVTLTVPRACVGRPSDVRSKVQAVAVDNEGRAGSSYLDAAGTKGHLPVWTRWVARG